MCEVQKYCIKSLLVCDNQADCYDASDEKDCPSPNPTCAEDKFDCYQNGSLCISKSKACNGESDCPNNSDELHCPDITKSKLTF